MTPTNRAAHAGLASPLIFWGGQRAGTPAPIALSPARPRPVLALASPVIRWGFNGRFAAPVATPSQFIGAGILEAVQAWWAAQSDLHDLF